MKPFFFGNVIYDHGVACRGCGLYTQKLSSMGIDTCLRCKHI